MISKKISLFLLCFVFLGFNLGAQEAPKEASPSQTNQSQKQVDQKNVPANAQGQQNIQTAPCNCGCAHPCKCGCQEGKPCKCEPRKQVADKCDCGCAHPCNCGCQEGKPCNCNPRQQAPSKCECGCAHPCKCGCAEGNPCNCNPRQKEPSKCDCGCEHPCKCGCDEGKPCHCLDQSCRDCGKNNNVASEDSNQESDQYGNNNQCNCGCAEGGCCNCNNLCCRDCDGFFSSEETEYSCLCRPYKRLNVTYGECDPAHGHECDYAYWYGGLCDCGYSTCEWQREYEVYCFDNCYYDEDAFDTCCACGIWMFEAPELFLPLMADPRQIVYSVGWRFNDRLFNKNVIDVSFGDAFPIYRWCDISWLDHSIAQIELEGGLWAIFEPMLESAPLVNADYYVGVPFTLAWRDWSFRLRGYHISSHIGDEFLLDHPGFDRRNASAEYLDFFASYQMFEELRLYAGLGGIVHQDNEFKLKRFYTEEGFEVHLYQLGFEDCCDHLRGSPIFAANFRWRAEFKGEIDQTYILGYEIAKTSGLCRKARIFGEFHDGFSAEGQFCLFRTRYAALRLTYGF